jgi:anti-anti-sigma factor
MPFSLETHVNQPIAVITLTGELDAAAAPTLRDAVTDLVGREGINTLVLEMSGLSFMASAGLRVLVFAKQKLGQGTELVIAGAQESVVETIELTGFHHSVTMTDRYEPGAS